MVRGLVVWAAVFVGSVAGAAETQRWALLVGVNDYVALNDLRFSVNDVQGLADTLRQSGFDNRRVLVLTDDAKDAAFRPFKANFQRHFANMLSLAAPGDLVIVSFCGHGIHVDGKSYLCPSEADTDRPVETMIAVDDVYQMFGECKASLKLLLVDACRNDPRPAGKRSATAQTDLRNLGASFDRPPDGILVLSSCAPGQISWEDKSLKHGVFMHHVLKGLSGEADGNRNGNITLGELYDYTSVETKLYVFNHFNDVQIPAQRGEINGVFELPRSVPTHWTNSLGMNFMLVPAGEFQMGSSNDDPDAEADEKPQHRVRITKRFYLSAYETTRAQFSEFAKAASYKTEAEKNGKGGFGYDATTNTLAGPDPQYTWRNTGYGLSEEHPATNVSWDDAQEFCRWLSKKEGKTYRLPTEAEWEYACRAGTTSRFSHDENAEGLAKIGNVADRSFNTKQPSGQSFGISEDDGYVFSAPVGQFKPSAFGLHDMTGNVAEWCEDRYAAAAYARSKTDDPPGPTTGNDRVIRGGSWAWNAASCRAAKRTPVLHDFATDDIGFRVVLVVNE